nr:MAG TPA_asm: hypothetical protein [Caudoviricetes sp.]
MRLFPEEINNKKLCLKTIQTTLVKSLTLKVR